MKKYGTDPKLNKLINDKNPYVRMTVANQGYGLDVLINDEDYRVRLLVASKGYGLNKLIYDENDDVRTEVARQGYGLDILVNDRDVFVRIAVARQGYGLDILINDEDEFVRVEVAEHGYGLNKLINDETKLVSEAVKNYLKANGYKSIAGWAKANPDRVYYKDKEVTNDFDTRCKMVKQGYDLDKFIDDEDYRIRVEVARQGYGLDKLVNDKKHDVCDEANKYIKDNFNNSLVRWYNENPDKRYYDSLRQIFDDQQCSDYCAKLLINDNYFLDYILKNTDSRSEARQHLIELGYNNIMDWMTNYPNNMYYSI